MRNERGEPLNRISEILPMLQSAIDEADEQFSDGRLDMDHYATVSEQLKVVADDFYRKFP